MTTGGHRQEGVAHGCDQAARAPLRGGSTTPGSGPGGTGGTGAGPGRDGSGGPGGIGGIGGTGVGVGGCGPGLGIEAQCPSWRAASSITGWVARNMVT